MNLVRGWAALREHGVHVVREYTYVRQRRRWLADDEFASRLYERVFGNELGPGRRVLDVGCGWGRFVSVFRRQAHRVYGVDLSARQWTYWRRLAAPGAQFLLGDGARLPFTDAAFDAVLCIGVLQEVPRPEEVIAEIVRVLRGDGVLFIEAPNDRSLWEGQGVDGGVMGALRRSGCHAMKTWGEGCRLPVISRIVTPVVPYAATVSYRATWAAKVVPSSLWMHRMMICRRERRGTPASMSPEQGRLATH